MEKMDGERMNIKSIKYDRISCFFSSIEMLNWTTYIFTFTT